MSHKANDHKVTEIELVYHNKKTHSERPSISSSECAYKTLMNAWDKNKIELQEQFNVMLLDRSNKCLGITKVSQGGVSSTLVDIKLVFAAALKARASGIIIAHNHPSGNLNFSEGDRTLTDRFAEAGKLLDIPVLDHLIVTKKGYSSLADNGLMPQVK